MTLVKLSTLRPGTVFLTKSSKLLVYQFRDGDQVVAIRYSDEYYTELVKTDAMVYVMDNL